MFTSIGSLRSRRILRSIFAVLLALGVFPAAFADTATRPSNWATAVTGVAGLGNLFQVAPELYRSRQPSAEALKNILAQHPIKDGAQPIRTVIALRVSDGGDGAVFGKSDAVHYEWLKFSPFHPVDEDVIKFLRIVTDKSSQPVLVHCAQGSDRTGMMVAIYRIVVQGWSKDDALKEMIQGGYGFHTFWHDLVAYIERLDVDALKAKLAQVTPSEQHIAAVAQGTAAPMR